MKDGLREILFEALSEVEKRLDDGGLRESGCADLSETACFNIKSELEQMLAVMSSSRYMPAYPRFLSDCPETELIRLLLEASYLYKQKT